MNRSLKMTYTVALLTVDDGSAASGQLSGRKIIPHDKTWTNPRRLAHSNS
ncbi:MAG TPA: hypothetical protein VL907_13540 [Pyrinomonadaceae bacterium]|jgi:hypothetical protein|nr:hypothetical protein [Pyrinomonadaceae bacterium]